MLLGRLRGVDLMMTKIIITQKTNTTTLGYGLTHFLDVLQAGMAALTENLWNNWRIFIFTRWLSNQLSKHKIPTIQC